MTGGGHPQQDRLYIVGTTHVQTNPSPNLISSRETPPSSTQQPFNLLLLHSPQVRTREITSDKDNKRALELQSLFPKSSSSFCSRVLLVRRGPMLLPPHKQAEPCCAHSLIWLTCHSSMRVGQQAGTGHRKNPL